MKRMTCQHGISPKSKCRKCRSEWERKYSNKRYNDDQIYRERRLEQNRRYGMEHRDKQKMRKKNYYEHNKEKLLQKRKERYIRERLELMRKWKETKKKLVGLLGGKCQQCGYSKCFSALDFHHINPDDKECNEEWARYPEKFIQKIKDGKVRLLCSNCHREVHHPNYGDN